MIWGDPPAGEPIQRYVLVADDGRWTELVFEEALVRLHGGPHALQGRRVRVSGRLVTRPGFEARQIQFLRVQSLQLDPWQVEPRQNEGPLRTQALSVAESRPFVTLLCRFGDLPNSTPHPVSYYETLMGTAYPGMDHYWRELSYNTINLAGSAVVGWYDLPQPRSYYVPGESADLGRDRKSVV